MLGKADLLLTDPPYGIGVDKAMHRSSGKKYGSAKCAKRTYKKTGWDVAPPRWLFEMLLTKARFGIIWGGNYFEGLPPNRGWLVWNKMNGKNGFADCELAWTNLPMAVRMREHRWNGFIRQDNEERWHPTQKPVGLMEWCVEKAKKADDILDPFMGAGTTLVAAKRLGRKSIGIELDEEYCEKAAKRLQEVNG